MSNATLPSILDWKDALTSIGLKESHVTNEFIATLKEHAISFSALNDDTFQGYWQGSTEDEAGIKIAKEFSVLHSNQEFLLSAINWSAAWHSLKTDERYLLVRTKEADTWALFMPK